MCERISKPRCHRARFLTIAEQLDVVCSIYATTNPHLGITISDDLKWHSHISTITKKANSTLGFLKRNIRRCPIKQQTDGIHCSCGLCLRIRSHSVGSIPSRGEDIDKLERIQHRSARFITGDYRCSHPGCVTIMLNNLILGLLEHRRRDQRVVKCMYQTVKGSIPALPSETFFRPPPIKTHST